MNEMKRSGSIWSFMLFALLVELILFGMQGITSLTAAAFGFAWAAAVFLLYKVAMDSDEKHESLVSKELFAYAVRRQTSNRLTFAFVTAIMLLPTNALIFKMDMARLVFYEMAAVILVDVLFEAVRQNWNKFSAYNLFVRKIEREESKNEIGHTEVRNFSHN